MAKQIILTQNNFGVPIELQFVSNTNSPVDLTDKTVEVAISYNGTIIDVLQATISSYTNGTAYIIVNTRHTSNVGLYTTFWSVRDEYGYITAQSDLYYYVKEEYNGAETPGIEQDKGTIEEKFNEINSSIGLLNEENSVISTRVSGIEIINSQLTNNIETINSQLDTIVKQQLPLTNQFSPYNNYVNNSKPTFSSSFSVGDSTFRPLYSEIDGKIKELAYCNPRGIVFCYHLIIEKGIVKIVQLDKTEMEHSEERVNYALSKLEEYNFTIRAIKLHTEFTNVDIDNNSDFWSSYHSCLSRIINKHQDVNLFYILNEVPTITSNSKYRDKIIEEINFVKSQGKKVSISNMGINELTNNLYNDYVDILSVNLYPFMSVNGLNTANIECLGSWDNAINELYDITKKYNKDVIISETGCLDKEESLQAPGDYTIKGDECNGEIKKIFYTGLFDYFEKSFIKEIFLWDGGSYSPYRHTTSLEVMKNNLGGGKNV